MPGTISRRCGRLARPSWQRRGNMPRHSEIRHLPYSPEQLFDLVADVRSYREFLPWVAAVRVRSDSPELMVADLVVGFKSLKETFTSRVTKHRPTDHQVGEAGGP